MRVLGCGAVGRDARPRLLSSGGSRGSRGVPESVPRGSRAPGGSDGRTPDRPGAADQLRRDPRRSGWGRARPAARRARARPGRRGQQCERCLRSLPGSRASGLRRQDAAHLHRSGRVGAPGRWCALRGSPPRPGQPPHAGAAEARRARRRRGAPSPARSPDPLADRRTGQRAGPGSDWHGDELLPDDHGALGSQTVPAEWLERLEARRPRAA